MFFSHYKAVHICGTNSNAFILITSTKKFGFAYSSRNWPPETPIIFPVLQVAASRAPVFVPKFD